MSIGKGAVDGELRAEDAGWGVAAFGQKFEGVDDHGVVLVLHPPEALDFRLGVLGGVQGAVLGLRDG